MLRSQEPPVDERTDTTSTALGAPHPPAPPGRLSVVFPRPLAAAFAIADRPFVLGRQGDGTLLHPTVSRTHAMVSWSAEAGVHVVRDLDSRNGSVLDGAPLTGRPRPLCDGSVLRLGCVVAVWEAGVAPEVGAADALEITTRLDLTTLDLTREPPRDLPPPGRPPVPSRDEFVAAFEQLGGSVRALARHFARDRRQIYRWIDAHDIADRR